MAEALTSGQLVVVGSSAGGIEALSTLVSTLPADFPAPIVIAQHLDPARPSHLAEILERRGILPVRSVTEVMALQPGVIFVVPANRHVEILDGHVSVRSESKSGPTPSVNLLLSSAAIAYEERLIAVILTGTGSDGAMGAREVSAAGGTVIIQNPATAHYPAMPQSLAPTTVDIVADIENIGPILVDLLTRAPDPTRPADDRALRAFLDELRSRSGIDFNGYKTPTILRRLQRRMVATGSASLTDYLRFMQKDPDEYQRLVSSFLIKVTEFFRDPELFAYLRDTILPALIEEARPRGNQLRFWSAGCATGEEAYSLAILLCDVLGADLPRFNVRIFATDLDNDAIMFARRGVYPATALVNLPTDLVERYFTRFDNEYEIKKQVRALTIFGQHDLGQRAPFPRIDLELCRNVLIYFTPELQRRALQLFTFSLRDGGYLVLGKSETTNPRSDHFVVEQPQLRIYRRQGDQTFFPSARYNDIPAPPPPVRLTISEPNVQPQRQREVQRTRIAREAFETLLVGLPMGVVIVDRRYDIQAINTTARRLLGIHSAAIGEDFLHLVQNVPAAPLRAAIDAALRGEPPTTGDEVDATEMATGEARYLELTCYPQKLGGGAEAFGNALVIVTDVTEKAQQRRALEETVARQHTESEWQNTQIKRLVEANQQLLDANQDLANSHMDLRVSNEELAITNEESQAATEEIETLNEELQATNEELETLNEELQATVEELNTTNDDLEARTAEMQETAVSLEIQRKASETEAVRLETILGGIGDAVLVVDPTGTTTLANGRYTEFFGGPEATFIAEGEDGQPLPPEATPQQRAARGESFSMQFTVTAPGGARRWFEANGQPLTGAKERSGVLVIRDITERSLRRMQDEFLAVASHELRTPLTGLSGYLQMLIRLFGDDTEQERPRRYATLAFEQAQRLMSLINELLDVARLQSGRMTLAEDRVDLAALVPRVAAIAQLLAESQTITMDAAPGQITVQGDERRLEQVVLNLLTNALAYAPGTDRIDVRLRRIETEAEIAVQDYGPGIPTTELQHIFSRFYRVERGIDPTSGGLGLGLYIAHEIVLAHGGTIDVQSTVGEGATFTIRLPLAEE